MRRGIVAVVITFTVLLLVSGPSSAITGGSPDGARHPNVGGLVAPVAYSGGTWLTCSGTLISSTVFLTAAHCDSDGQHVRVTFSSAYHDGDTVYDGVFRQDPNYTNAQGDPHDMAVVVFASAVNGITPARLPRAGTLSNLPKNQTFTSVGYGAYAVQKGPGGHSYLYNDVRNVATGTLNATNQSWLKISQNSSAGNGGTCYGDSGGPNFLGTTDVIAATTNTGDRTCRSTNVAYRLDTMSARQFLAGFVPLP